jgi:hypothetical protein
MWGPLVSEVTFPKATAAQPNGLSTIPQQICQSYFFESHSHNNFFKSHIPTKHSLNVLVDLLKNKMHKVNPIGMYNGS